MSNKRTHGELSDTEENQPKRLSNKRRNLGSGELAPSARLRARRTPASRRIQNNPVPYSERLRRMNLEAYQGRIRRTVFRLPQVAAQAEAERRAPRSDSDEEDVSPAEESSAEQNPFMPNPSEFSGQASQSISSSKLGQAPETPNKSWSIRGLINSVPRSFARLLPGWRSNPQPSAAPGKYSIFSMNCPHIAYEFQKHSGLHPSVLLAQPIFMKAVMVRGTMLRRRMSQGTARRTKKSYLLS